METEPAQDRDADAAFHFGAPQVGEALAAADALPGAADLPPTRVVEEPLPPPAAAAALCAAEDLAETRVTAAFLGAETPPAPRAPQPAGHFTVVADEELDSDEIEAEHAPFWHMSPTTLVLAFGLVAVGVSVWYFLRPLSADALYGRITSRLDGTREALLQAESDIEAFVMQFPQDARAGQLRGYEKEIELYHLERKFDLHVRGLSAAENLLPIERAYLEAINYLRLDPDRGMAKLQALVDLYGQHTDTSGPTGQCIELARRRLAQLHKELDRATADLQELVHDQLEEAQQVGASDPKRAAAMYRAILELFGDKPWAKQSVQKARGALDAQTAP